jgi:hypothetical protein
VTCSECNDSGITVVTIIAICTGLVAALFVLVKTCGSRVLAYFGKQTGLSFISLYSRSSTINFTQRKKNFLNSEEISRKYQSKLKQIITMFQILSALPSTVSFLSFPSVYYQLTFLFELLNIGTLFNDLGLVCSLEGLDYVSSVIAATLIPIAASLFLYLAQLGHVYFTLHQFTEQFRTAARTYERIVVLTSTYFYIFLFGTYLVLPGVSKLLFGMLRPCVNLDPEDTQGESYFYLEADYSIECSSDRYHLGVAWATVFVFVYPVGIPGLYFYLLYEARPLIKGRAKADINALDEEGLQKLENAAMTLSSLRFLYEEYLPEVTQPVTCED